MTSSAVASERRAGRVVLRVYGGLVRDLIRACLGFHGPEKWGRYGSITLQTVESCKVSADQGVTTAEASGLCSFCDHLCMLAFFFF